MATKAYGAGIRHAEVMDDQGDIVDMEAVINVEGSMEIESTEIKGDDEVKVTFYQSQKISLSGEANAWNIDVVEKISGNTPATEVGPPTADNIAIGTNAETNPPFVQLKTKTRAKATDGTVVTIEIVYHKCQLMIENLAQALESEMPLSLTGVAYRTATDIEGNALADTRIATVSIVDDDTTPA